MAFFVVANIYDNMQDSGLFFYIFANAITNKNYSLKQKVRGFANHPRQRGQRTCAARRGGAVSGEHDHNGQVDAAKP